MSKKTWGLVLCIIVVLLDQLTKAWIVTNIQSPAQYLYLGPFLTILKTYNPGISFGLLGGVMSPWALSALATAISIYLAYIFYTSKSWLAALSLGAILGGAIGNIIDRMRIGKVVDFISLHYGNYSWPAFNVADIGVTVGAVFFLYAALFRKSM